MAPIREYLCMVLDREPDMKVINAVGGGAEAIECALANHPDVLLMDLDIGISRTGVDAMKTITTLAPNIRLIALTLFNDDDNVFSAMEAGASDYVLKNSSATEISEAIRTVANEAFPLRSQIAHLIRNEIQILRSERNVLITTLRVIFGLTPKELGILRFLVNGKDINKISELSNVEFFIRNILRKFGESSIDNIVNRLYRLGISEVFTNERLGKIK